MKKLTLEEYQAFDRDVRVALRRRAFGHPRELPPQLEGQFDLEHLREQLVAENDRTGWFPDPWEPGAEDDEHGVEELL